MDDYYELLGVAPDAQTDEIRSAYRERKEALDSKSDAAKLNKAWNVLSDPYQRGRYDEQRAKAPEMDDDVVDDDVPARSNGRRAKPAAPARGRRPMAEPTITPPAGTRFPQPKNRVIAMAIDLFVLVVLFIGSQFVAQVVADSGHHKTVTCINALRDAVSKESSAKDKNAVQTDPKIDTARTKCAPANVKVTGAYNADNKTLTDQDNKLQPIFNAVVGGFFLIGLLYLVIPSMISGRTFGKRLRRLRVLREDGSPLRAGDAIKRYGMLILVTYALSFILGPLAAVIVLVGATTWMRNPNMQGLHDRVTHTIVVQDAA